MNDIDKAGGKRRRIAIGITALVIAVAGGWIAFARVSADKPGEQHAEEGHKEGPDELTLTSDEAKKAGIQTQAVQAQAVADTIEATATIQANQERIAFVAPRVEARVRSVAVKLGDNVRAGQALATLDSLQVGEAYAAWVQAQSELRIAEADLKRVESLAADEIIPRKELLRAQAEREKAAAAVRNTTDRLQLLGAAPRAGATAVSLLTVVSPIAGTVIERKATLGGLASPSESLFTVADLSRVWIQAALPESALAKVRVGASARVTVPAYPQQVFQGRVSHIGAGVDKESRAVSARIEVGNPEGKLKPEMFANAVIETGGNARSGISLPDDAIVLMQGQPTVFVFDAGAYAQRVVQTGERSGGRTTIVAGLQPGEQVVTAGAYALKARKMKSSVGHGH